MLTTFALLTAAAAAAALALLAIGLRGRRVDDHPLCRRCGFDLTGRPEESARCAECGAELGRPRATRIGHRRRRRGMLTLAAALLIAGGTPLGLIGWGRAKGVDWNRHKPGWWLVADVKGADPPTRDAALAELTRRIGAGTLSGGNVAALVGRALAEQGDPAKPWLPAWGDVVEQARAAGRLDDEQWARYLRQAIGPEALKLTVGRGRPGDLVDVEVKRGTLRAGKGRSGLVAFFRVPSLHAWFAPRPGLPALLVDRLVNGKPAPNPDWDRITPNGVLLGSMSGWGATSTRDTAANVAGPGARPGPQTARVPVQVRVYDIEDPQATLMAATDGAEPAAEYLRAEVVVEVTDEWVLLPNDWDPRVADPSQAEAVRRAISVSDAYVAGGKSLSIGVVIRDPPVNVAFAVFARGGGREVRVGRIAARAGSGAWEPAEGALPGLRERDRIDLVFRPDPAAAAGDELMADYWDGEVVLEDIALGPAPEPSTRPRRR